MRKGFTLAETLITLTVIGLVAAITIPVLLNSGASKTKMMFKKSYCLVEESIGNVIKNQANYPTDETNTTVNTSYPMTKGLNYTDATSNGSVNKFCYFLTQELSTVGAVNCISTSATGNSTFSTTDGMTWTLYTPISDSTSISYENSSNAGTVGYAQFPLSSASYVTKIIIDVNGSAQKPNCTADTGYATYALSYCASSPDIFIIGVRYDGTLQIGSGANTDSVVNSILSAPTNSSK